jgi:3-dehydroshikimate dehydratase
LCKVFGTNNIRLFSYYKPEDDSWDKWRPEVHARMAEKVRRAEKAGVRLLHENEHNIYGDSPQRVLDLVTTFKAPHFYAVYDAANYVFCGYDPWQGWEMSRDRTGHFHIKDWIAGASHGSLAGEGQGQLPRVLADAVKRDYDGFATMEPHLLGGGPTGGVTGPDLFPKAVLAFTSILEKAGGKYR